MRELYAPDLGQFLSDFYWVKAKSLPVLNRATFLPLIDPISSITSQIDNEEEVTNSGYIILKMGAKKEKRCWMVLKDHVLYRYKAIEVRQLEINLALKLRLVQIQSH